MKYLSSKDVLLIHSLVIDETGGSHGLRDLGLLESAVARPQHSFGGKDLYSSLEEKAAVLFMSLVRNHPFVDGNKRTAVTAVGVFLESNGYRLRGEATELVDLVLGVAIKKYDEHHVTHWLKLHDKDS